MAKKRLGQHFLSDPRILDRIVTFSRVGPEDAVVEIGPGRGALTHPLAALARTVTAIEFDTDLIPRLRESMPANVTIIEADALEVDYTAIAPAGYALVGNLPYNISTPLIERFAAARKTIGSVTIMVQKEVADRILAPPGGKDYGPLSIGVQYFANLERGFVLPPGAFSPPPKVDSRMLRWTWKPDVVDNPAFLKFVRGAFASRRKTLVNNLEAMGYPRDRVPPALASHGLAPTARPEQLSLEQFCALFDALSK